MSEALPTRHFSHEEVGAERQLATDFWFKVELLASEALRKVVGADPAYWFWGFVERLCRESEAAAADNHVRALALAELGVDVASWLAGEPKLRSRLQGYAWAFVANSLRVACDLTGASTALEKARVLWEEGALIDPGVLDEARFLDLEASLRRAQRLFPEALACLRLALVKAEPTARPEFLINLANLLIDMNRHEEAILPLQEAIARIDPTSAPRLAWAARFNLLVCLCALDRAAEGEAWLLDLRHLARAMGNAIDQLRLRWLEGQVHAGLGRPAEAIAALEETRDGFSTRAMHYDVALVGLELCVVLLGEGRTPEVRSQAPSLAATFQQLGIERERLATLTLFCAAAQAEQATVEQARAALELLRRAEG